MKSYCKEFYSVIRTEDADPNSSEGKMLKLYWILGKCLDTLRVIQHSDTPKKQADSEMNKLKLMVSDIAVALTNEDIYFRSEVDEMMEKAHDFHQGETKKKDETTNDKILDKIETFLERDDVKTGITYINDFIKEIKEKSRK